MKNCLTEIKNCVEWDFNHQLVALLVNACYIFVFYTLPLMNGELCRLVKVNSIILKDAAFILSKCHFEWCTHCWATSVLKTADGWIDGFSYISLSSLIFVPIKLNTVYVHKTAGQIICMFTLCYWLVHVKLTRQCQSCCFVM